MKRIEYIIILLAFLAIGCNAKKKLVSEVKQSAVVSVQADKESSTQATKSVQDTTRTKVKEVETNRERIIEEYIFNSDGRVSEYRKETDRSGERQKDSDTRLGVNTDSIRIDAMREQLKMDSTSTIDSRIKDKEVTPPNPLWHWIGGAILLAVVLYIVKKIYL